MDKAESRVTPRLFTLDAKGIRQPAKTMESLEIPDRTDGLHSTIASVLSSLSLSKITDTKGAENLSREGMLRLVEMDIQVSQQHHIGL